MKFFSSLFALVSLLLALSSALSATPPNIVYVLFDDLGYGEPTCYRPESKIKTPNIDRLAAQGMRFTDAHSASSVCTPTRYGILTGRYPMRIGQFGVLTSYDPPIIPESRLTVASFLKQNGYETACIGKWHLGLKWENITKPKDSPLIGARIFSGPNQLGFDYFYGFTHARDIGTIIEQDRVAEHVAERENQPKMIAKAIEWLEKREPEKPFFLYFPMCPPHTPIAPSAEFEGKSGAVDEVKNDPKYGDWVFQGDHMLGQLMDALEKKGISKNTIVIATADNGAAKRAYQPLRNQKTSIYEGGHRVPFIVRWPDKIKAGFISGQIICHNDLIATCADLIGAKLPDDAGEDSVSILPVLLEKTTQPIREATIHQAAAPDLAIRQGAWKLIVFQKGKPALYDLAKDIGESQNIADQHPEVVEKLTALLKRYIDEGRSTPGESQPVESSAWQLQKSK
jgi:arylsulfatase A